MQGNAVTQQHQNPYPLSGQLWKRNMNVFLHPAFLNDSEIQRLTGRRDIQSFYNYRDLYITPLLDER